MTYEEYRAKVEKTTLHVCGARRVGMTPEPKEVQLARELIAIGKGLSGGTRETFDLANRVVYAHEANLEHGRQQEEARKLAIEETAKRWPELAAKGWMYVESEYFHTMVSEESPESAISKVNRELIIDCNADTCVAVDVDVALALIDAAGLNTTANCASRYAAKLNTTANKLRDAISFALHELDPDSRAYLMLKRVLGASNV